MLRAGRVHDGPDVVDPLLQGRRPGYRVGQSGSALVEQDQRREGRQAFEECDRVRFLPPQLQMETNPGANRRSRGPSPTTW
jgi:hypothetical protein